MDRTGLKVVRDRIAAAARRADRMTDTVELVVVSKYASDQAVEAVIAEGATALGESRADAIVRRAAEHPEVQWHFIGHLQRNKVSKVRPAAHVLHALDRAALVPGWAGDGGAPPVYIQVDLADEPQKGGCTPAGAPALVARCVEAGIPVLGLMTIPPQGLRPEDARPWFARLRDLRDTVVRDHPQVAGLSMGMTDDFEVAVEEGATVLRVGRAIFDPFEHNEG